MPKGQYFLVSDLVKLFPYPTSKRSPHGAR